MNGIVMVATSDPWREYMSLRQELDGAILRVLASGAYVREHEVASLEGEFAAFCGVRYAVSTASGTVALLVGLKAVGISPGDEVITAPYTCISTTAAITNAGAKVRFADVEEETLTLDPAQVERCLTSRTRAILPVHAHGQVTEMDPLCQLTETHDLFLLEDAALAAGATYRRRRVGSLGQAGAFSFAPGKVLGGLGWGGMLITDEPAIAVRARQLAGYGPAECNIETADSLEGYSAQLSSVLAAVLRVKLQRLEPWIEKRRAIAAQYDEACDRLGIWRLHPRPWTEPSYQVYVIRVQDRECWLSRLQDLGIQARTFWVPPLHLRPVYGRLGYRPGDFPITERATEQLICLPVHAQLTDDEVSRVIEILETLV